MSTSIDELAEGGRGIKLMWQIADKLSYTRTCEGRNCLLLSKSYDAEGRVRHKTNQKASALDGLLNFLNRWDWLDIEQQEEVLDDIPVRTLNLEVNTDLNDVTKVFELFEQLQDLSFPSETWYALQLAVVEGFTNAVRHAHKNLPVETPIQLEVMVFHGRLEFRIWDGGVYFDLDAKITEFILEDRRFCFNLNDFSDTSLIPPSKKNTFVNSQFLIAG
ncbi:ATP-binding protein [Microcoleus sp.]|uniref:ATP-binding protein n=1 Tax=Microcoleus sp. TaxID=44472 RepID=UPI00352358AF